MPSVVVDANTGNVLVVHRRSLGLASVLFFVAIISFIFAGYSGNPAVSEGLYSFGSLCCLLLLVVLLWRCCRCCCASHRAEATGYVVVQSARANTNAQVPQAYPTQSSQALLMPGVQPAYNPNIVGPTVPQAEAPPSYADAVGIPIKQ
ncbi:uncharacterized protein LOC100903932 [Galendromus occidentalis]|uniref:Uncharacterized protein LOC100903932 n=1 Tax=Galendromus occidentalis TaxID=34638 RepID=A0AAJ6QRD5_9ACAR|nr:uncharacterized protein LOC100903932 [Galendromus occidentalis]